MATAKSYFSLLPILTISILFLPTIFGYESVKCSNGQGKTWCVAKPSASEEELAENIKFACKYVDCRLIQEGGDCYDPKNTINHASAVMNYYYQIMGRNTWNCDFKKSALITLTNPSYGCCKYM